MPLEKFDSVVDTKADKQAARMMMRMVGEIDGQVTKAMPDTGQVRYWLRKGT